MFGAVSAMVGVGMIVGTQLVTRLVRNRSKANVVLGGLFSLGIGAALLGTFRNSPMAAVSTFTMGLAIAFVWIPAQTMSQQETPPAMVGRVSSTFMSLISLSQVFGLLLSGYLAQKLGIRSVFMACAGSAGLDFRHWISDDARPSRRACGPCGPGTCQCSVHRGKPGVLK